MRQHIPQRTDLPTTVCALIVLAAIPAATAATHGGETADTAAAADSSLVLRGDGGGSALGSLTVEGENRIQVAFERPDLGIDLDPREAPGLVWGSPMDVLDRSRPDLMGPYLAAGAGQRSPYAPHPWLASLRTGPVARFRPAVEDVAEWRLSVVDSRGETVIAFAGRKSPPDEIAWDGRDGAGDLCPPGFTYSYVFEATDRAGNPRRFAGESFRLPAYRVDDENGLHVLVTADWLGLRSGRPGDGTSPSAGLLEVASWLNLRSGPDEGLRMVAVARDHARAERLGEDLRLTLAPLLLGDAARLAVVTRADPGAPENGVVSLTTVVGQE
jgi:hypothetical protein